MGMFLVLAGIVVTAAAVIGWMFFSLKREANDEKALDAVPVHSSGEVVPGELSEITALPVSPAALEQVGGGLDPAPVSLPLVVAMHDQDEVARLKEEIQSIRAKAVDQARNAIDVITKLRQENESFRAGADRQEQSRHQEDAERVGHLKAENAAFREQVDAARQELSRVMAEAGDIRRELEDRLASIQESAIQHDQDRMGGLRQELESLRRDNEMLKASQAVQSENISAHSFLNAEAVEALKEDLETIRQSRAALETRVEELEEVIRGAQEQGKFLQYELVKSRAQAAGMERVCDTARRHFEGVARNVRMAEPDNDVFKEQQVGALAQGVSDFRRLNAELLKREKLARFEMEQDRSGYR